MESPVISNDYFKSQCMEYLLLSSNKHREYVIQYLSGHYDVLPVSVLQKRCFIFIVQSVILMTMILFGFIDSKTQIPLSYR